MDYLHHLDLLNLIQKNSKYIYIRYIHIDWYLNRIPSCCYPMFFLIGAIIVFIQLGGKPKSDIFSSVTSTTSLLPPRFLIIQEFHSSPLRM